VDLKKAVEAGQLDIRKLDMMINHHTTQIFINDLEIPAENLIGQEGEGFRYILSGANTERILVASEAIGDGYWFVERASKYASERVVFGQPIGANQGVQFPIAQAYAQIEAASLMRFKAAAKIDSGQDAPAEANMAKLLASQASWAAANAALDAHGGNGFTVEFDVERKFRETRLFMTAPINNNLVLAYVGQHVLGMPKTF
jgi:acyl-CoA dehydrogenase